MVAKFNFVIEGFEFKSNDQKCELPKFQFQFDQECTAQELGDSFKALVDVVKPMLEAVTTSSQNNDYGISNAICDTYDKVSSINVKTERVIRSVSDIKHRMFDLNSKIDDLNSKIDVKESINKIFKEDFREVNNEKTNSKEEEDSKKDDDDNQW